MLVHNIMTCCSVIHFMTNNRCYTGYAGIESGPIPSSHCDSRRNAIYCLALLLLQTRMAQHIYRHLYADTVCVHHHCKIAALSDCGTAHYRMLQCTVF